MSISSKLQTVFFALECAAFEEWKNATPERREEITKMLGRLEGKMIIDEIEAEANRLYPVNK